MKSKKELRNLIFAALFFALAMLLPFLSGQIPEINSVFCPMHIPIFLCGFICGWKWGLAIGFSAPLLRSATFGFPVFYPIAVSMAFELAAYGLICGLLHKLLPKKKPFIYCSLISAMIVGRILRALATLVCTELVGNSFALSAFITGVIVKSIPGIISHLIIVPLLVILIENILKKQKNKYSH